MVSDIPQNLVKTAQEIQSTWRLYVKEWVFDCRGDTELDAWASVDEKYEGRVHSEDLDVSWDYESNTAVGRVRLWNVRGEWKTEEDCRNHENLLQEVRPDLEPTSVPRNSRQEHLLLNYGKLKLLEVK
jgi:hypothetical protein